MLKINTLPNGMREIVATEGYVCRHGEAPSEIRRRLLLPTENPEDFEEATELPAFTREQYTERVRSLIAARYSIEDELALNRQRDSKPDEWAAYNDFCEQCKAEAREQLTIHNS